MLTQTFFLFLISAACWEAPVINPRWDDFVPYKGKWVAMDRQGRPVASANEKEDLEWTAPSTEYYHIHLNPDWDPRAEALDYGYLQEQTSEVVRLQPTNDGKEIEILPTGAEVTDEGMFVGQLAELDDDGNSAWIPSVVVERVVVKHGRKKIEPQRLNVTKPFVFQVDSGAAMSLISWDLGKTHFRFTNNSHDKWVNISGVVGVGQGSLKQVTVKIAGEIFSIPVVWAPGFTKQYGLLGRRSLYEKFATFIDPFTLREDCDHKEFGKGACTGKLHFFPQHFGVAAREKLSLYQGNAP
eukprot:TRINITY_DN74845_c0_g1_i1.p1 TRINITY_DN74845_c0_g1~~TRINITY_DN74845_c0_g1_i1.p1  ORF type:complete len:297 (-),score=28.09 TRINITY_DN74845_c0_g1_i1:60-950(-)